MKWLHNNTKTPQTPRYFLPLEVLMFTASNKRQLYCCQQWAVNPYRGLNI